MPLICRRCLLQDMEDERPLYLLMQQWLAAIPDERKAAPDVYLVRLEVCKSCNELANGMCKLCGCYVELRAAKTDQCCPSVLRKWGKIAAQCHQGF